MNTGRVAGEFKLRILICSEGFILDGVASYHLHLALAFKNAGHTVGILGRWMGFSGYQKRYQHTGISVLEYFSPVVVCPKALQMARDFAPDVLIADSRRAFPLAQEINEKTGTPIITIFMDSPQGKNKKGRTLEEIERNSRAWISPEKSLYLEMLALNPSLPVRQLRRPVVEEWMPPTPIRPKEPFSVLCLGRLSRYKIPGLLSVLHNASQLKSVIPSLDITVVGGDWRRAYFMREAFQKNLAAGNRYIRTVGYQKDPAPWFARSNVVCTGSTCALEAILCNRPVIAVSTYWFGLITPENLDEAIACYYAERAGRFHASENPDVIVNTLIELYENWNVEQLTHDQKIMRERFLPLFDPATAVKEWEDLFNEVL